MNRSLPETVSVGGIEYAVLTDYGAILDILSALRDPELPPAIQRLEALKIFYPDFDDMPAEDYPEAFERCCWFIDGGEPNLGSKSPQLVNWEKDFPRIAPPISKALGVLDIRQMPHLHWWTFLAGYMGIGDCFFAHIVNIRSKKARGKKLDKAEMEFYRLNRDVIEIPKTYTSAEDALVAKYT